MAASEGGLGSSWEPGSAQDSSPCGSLLSMPDGESRARPTAPFRPARCTVVGPTRRTTTTRPRGPIYGAEKLGPDGTPLRDGHGRPLREVVGWEQPGKSRVCWDVEVRCDGHRWQDRHYAAGRAQVAKEELEAGFRQGLKFDPATTRFVADAPSATAAPTVYSEALSWWRAHWSTIEPKSRKETLRYIARPIRELVRHDGTPAPAGIEDYLSWQLLPPKGLDVPVPPEHARAAAWLGEHSLAVQSVDAAAWQAYVERWRVNSRTGRPLAQASLQRHLADVKQMWAWVSAVHHLPNPWQTVETASRSSVGGRRGSTVRPVDRTVVLAPAHVRELALLCGQGDFGALAEVYVLLLGIAGGRPGESAGVEIPDLDLSGDGVGEVRFSRTTRRSINPSFLDADDDFAWGPLKGREINDVRRAPLPSPDARRIRELIASAGRTGPLFPDWDWGKFSRDVWVPAKTEMAARHERTASSTSAAARHEADALVSALGRLRLHDLRHAACSMWLNTPGVEVRVACEWSGHKRLSVFLDIYQGVMPGSETSAKQKLDAAWGRP